MLKRLCNPIYAMAAVVAMACSFIATTTPIKATEAPYVPEYGIPSQNAIRLDTIFVDLKEVRGPICILDTVYVSYSPSTTTGAKGRESFFPNASRDLSQTWFTWGADIGASIDMSTDDMSTFDINAYFGYRNRVIRTLGFGAGVHQAFGNSHTFIPVYAILRTSFTSKPSMFFGELKGGYSFNTIARDHSQGGAYFSAGVGINLARSSHFQSHIILSYGWMGMKPFDSADDTRHGKHLNYATLRLGISF